MCLSGEPESNTQIPVIPHMFGKVPIWIKSLYHFYRDQSWTVKLYEQADYYGEVSKHLMNGFLKEKIFVKYTYEYTKTHCKALSTSANTLLANATHKSIRPKSACISLEHSAPYKPGKPDDGYKRIPVGKSSHLVGSLQHSSELQNECLRTKLWEDKAGNWIQGGNVKGLRREGSGRRNTVAIGDSKCRIV